jgi:formylglycine-generating enzyme required for sulfatase activity
MKKRAFVVRILVLAVLIVGLSSLTLNLGKDKYVQIDQKIFASRYEVTNIEFREFLNSKGTEMKQIKKFQYDSIQWKKKFPYAFNEPLVNFYHWHPAYNDYPVVNITHETAEAYCKWLTIKYNDSFRKKFEKVIFRLPTEAEWVTLSGAGKNQLPWDGYTVFAKDDKSIMANVKAHTDVANKADYNFDGSICTSKVGNFKANKHGLYDVIGNAYELTQSGVQKGGSWDSFIEECTADQSQKLELPDPRVGFRVVMEVIEE